MLLLVSDWNKVVEKGDVLSIEITIVERDDVFVEFIRSTNEVEYELDDMECSDLARSKCSRGAEASTGRVIFAIDPIDCEADCEVVKAGNVERVSLGAKLICSIMIVPDNRVSSSSDCGGGQSPSIGWKISRQQKPSRQKAAIQAISTASDPSPQSYPKGHGPAPGQTIPMFAHDVRPDESQ